MIYSFRSDNNNYKHFITVLTDHALDYEIIKRDNVVIRIFGRVDQSLKQALDDAAEKAGRLILLKKGEDKEHNLRLELPKTPFLIAGPCAVESEAQLDQIAAHVSTKGVRILRGGAFKPRTQSSSFQGLGRVGLTIMSKIAARYDMQVITELMDRSQLDDVAAAADIIQVGSRNMFNYSLLTALGAVDKPVLLKRGMSATIDEWLYAADYIRKGGNEKIILCERGIRTFETKTRFTLDILAIPIAQKLSGLPVVADVSHAAGDRSLVPPLALAALAVGADGVMIEVHPEPDKALSDSKQSLSFDEFDSLFRQIEEMGFGESTGAATARPLPL